MGEKWELCGKCLGFFQVPLSIGAFNPLERNLMCLLVFFQTLNEILVGGFNPSEKS